MAPRAVGLQVEVVGCQTICTHCWAQGVPYNAMPLQDIAWVLEQAAWFRAATGLPVDAFPMHEVAAHPQASTVMRLFQDFSGVMAGQATAERTYCVDRPRLTRRTASAILSPLYRSLCVVENTRKGSGWAKQTGSPC
jgi:hypothetical protein